MKVVKFIRGVVIDDVLVDNLEEIQYYTVKDFTKYDEYKLPSTLDRTIDYKVVPVTKFLNYNRDGIDREVYIAFSEEVEEWLGVPIRTIIKESRELEMLNSKLEVENAELIGYYKKLSRKLDVLKEDICRYRDRFDNMSFFNRLKFLFSKGKSK